MYRIIIGSILLTVMLSGCKTREYKARNYYMDNRAKLAELANTVFPPRAEYKPGIEVKLKPDTMHRAADTVFVQGDCPDGTKITVKCPPCDTVIVYIPVLRVDTAFIPDDRGKEVLQEKASESDKDNIKLQVLLEIEKKRSKSRLIWACIATLGIGLSIAWKVFNLKGKFGL